MECPHCSRDIPVTAVRCRYCRRVVREDARSTKAGLFTVYLRGFASSLRYFFTEGILPSACRWSYSDVILITLLLWLFMTNDPLNISAGVFKYLRLNFPGMAADPRFFYYLGIYMSTMIFKAVSLVLVVALVRARGANFVKDVLSPGHIPELWWKTHLPLYTIACLVIRDINSLNPLVPNLPFDSVYPASKFIGNAVVIFSVLFVAPFVEEVIFRGFLYPGLNRYMGMRPAVFLTAALFTLAHYPQVKDEAVFMVTIFSLGLMITYARAATGSTLLAMILHHIYNLMYVGVGMVNYLIFKY